EGRVALITGASKGIGKAVAKKLAKHGASIAAAATNKGLLENLVQELVDSGVECIALPCDVSRLQDCEHFVQKILSRFEKIDILVNSAGVGYSGKIVESNPVEVDKMIKVNVLGVYYMTRSVLPGMIKHRNGDVVNIGSVAGIKYSPNFAIYSATKFAVRAFSEALRNEVQCHHIRVTLIHPGMTKTPFFDSFSKGGSPIPVDKGDILRPEDIASAIYFALTRPDGVALNELTVRPTWQER
ncbi:SDR family oxidoreductase, partial [bacterium]|nr:SDR family oxidoreductase [bacterium]